MLIVAAVIALGLGGLAAYQLTRVDLAWTFSLAIGLSMFSGNWQYIHIPIGLDRLLIALGVSVLAWRTWQRARNGLPVEFPPVHTIHVLMLVLTVYAGISAATNHDLFQTEGFFALLDRLGAMPFLLLYLSPMIFGTREQRMILLTVLTGVGAYLSIITFLPSFGLSQFVFPSFITDPSVGIHADRARGPFLEAAAHGLALVLSGISAAVLALLTDRRNVRITAGVVAVACQIATMLTLTRSVWLSAIAAVCVFGLSHPALRRGAIPGIAAMAAVAALVFVNVPGLQSQADERAAAENPIWDRLNTNNAAIRATKEHPIFGIGFNRFPVEGPQYLEQADNYPLTASSVGLPVHNAPLGYLTELGFVGFSLWVAIIYLAGAPLRRRPTTKEGLAWRSGLAAVATGWFTVAMFIPAGQAFPLLVLYTYAGVAATVPAYARAPRRAPEALSAPAAGAAA